MNKMSNMEDEVRMVSLHGFIAVFWERVRADRSRGGNLTYQQIYSGMEADYEGRYGVTRFPSYDAFRKARERYKTP